MLKDLLKRMLKSKKLALAQIENLLFEVEAVINCRPLTYCIRGFRKRLA
jgi:hypothetical protein